MIDVILVLRLAREDHFQRRSRNVCRQITNVSRSFALRVKKDHRLVARTESSKIEQLVFLIIEQIAFISAENVAEKLVAAFGDRVFSYVKERLVVSGPG